MLRRSAHFRLAALAVTVAGLLLAGACTPVERPETAGRKLDSGIASWYGPKFHGKRTANGEVYDMLAMTAAHKTLPFGTRVEVRNRTNGRSVVVRINDRGPFVRGRVIDLSRAAADLIDMLGSGTAPVDVYLVEGATESVFVVQAGAFRDVRLAEGLRDELAADYAAVRVVDGDGWYRVQIGAWEDRREARRALSQLRRQGREAVLKEVPAP